MAFTTTIAGDRYHKDCSNIFPRAPKAGYTPATGDLVLVDTSIANGVDLIAANENPAGIVERFFNGVASVHFFRPGDEIILPYSGALVKGDKVEGDGGAATHGTLVDRSPVRVDNTTGVGVVVAVDAETPHGVGHASVRF